MILLWNLAMILIVRSEDAEGFQGTESVSAELFSLSKQYYSLIGGGPSDGELSEIFISGSEHMGKLAKGKMFLDTWTNLVLNGLREVVNAASPESRLDSLLYEPFHWFMRGLRHRGLWLSLVKLLSPLAKMVEIHKRTKAQVGFYLYFVGLEDYIGASNPKLTARQRRSQTIEFIETDLSSIVSNSESIAMRYRTYTDNDVKLFPVDVLVFQRMISKGLADISPESKSVALNLFNRYFEFKQDVLNRILSIRQSEIKSAFADEMHDIANAIQSSGILDNNS
jgi:hypothetical protein